MTAGRTNHTKFAAPPRDIVFDSPCGNWGTVLPAVEVPKKILSISTEDFMSAAAVLVDGLVRDNDPCPSCDGEHYDEAAGECHECGYVLPDA